MLVSPVVADRFLDSCNLGRESRILEIGAGRGILTQKLAERVAFVESFEIDRKLFEATSKLVSPYRNVKLICADAFDYHLRGERFDSCVTSLPYAASLKFVRWLVQRSGQFSMASAIVQSEFAKKLASDPGVPSFRAVSVMAQISFKVELGFKIGRRAFSPPPKVESRVVHFIPNNEVDLPFFNVKKIRILDFIFSFRGRHLSSALKKLLQDKKVEAFSQDLLSSRVESIPPKEYLKIISQTEEMIP
jgi:16S rRNA (adenine1518-N6/adenine1519-N6)-dimethyltransferase